MLQVLAALTSERGSTLVTLAIGVACRSSVEALAATQQRAEAAAAAAGRADLPERLMRFAGAPRLYCTCPPRHEPGLLNISNLPHELLAGTQGELMLSAHALWHCLLQ